ncbi:MAG: T9SS type A sorting domain-containing protein [candidate division SR1 bacterium]|nr:T9SS type A sorting domain-containing protein [candidate division SR1 bacterium]
MKKFFTIVCMLISLSLSASHVHLSLTGVANAAHFYYCTTVDTVFVSKPSGGGITDWNNGGGYITADSIPITHTSQGYWTCQYGPTSIIEFYVNFVSISPTTPWTATDISKCPGVATVLAGQTNPQPDFTYVWSPGGATSPTINAVTPGIYSVTVTGACATVTDQIEVINYPVPVPNLGPNVTACNGNTVLLDPGSFNGYSWSTGVSTPNISVTTGGPYSVTVTDVHGCHASDTIGVTFFSPYTGEQICYVTKGFVSNLNEVAFSATPGQKISFYNVKKESSQTGVYTLVKKIPHTGSGVIVVIDSTDNSTIQYTYNITIEDSCGNESPLGGKVKPIFSTLSVNELGTYNIHLLQYYDENDPTVPTTTYIYSGDTLPLTLRDSIAGGVTDYVVPPSNTDSIFAGAVILPCGGSKGMHLAFSNRVSKSHALAVTEVAIQKTEIPIYPNPSTGMFTVSGNGVLSVYNDIGEHISTENIQGTAIINISTPGIYLVKITDKDNATFTQKVIIQ